MASGGLVATRAAPLLDWNAGVVVLLSIAVIAPVVVVPGTFFPYVVPRNILFRAAIELAALVCVAQVFLGGKRLDVRREYVLGAIGLFLVAATLSAIFSPAPTRSFFGDFERMGGVWAWLHLAAFVLVLRTITERNLAWVIHVALAACVGASVHAIVERVWIGGDLTVVGNAGLFAGYVLVGIGLALYLAAGTHRFRSFYLAAAGIELGALLISGNRSSVLGLLVGGVAGAVVFAMGGKRDHRRWIPLWLAAAMGAAVALLVAVVRLSDSPWVTKVLPRVFRRIAATDLGGFDALRTMQWDAALAGFRDRPLVGFGPENYQLVWSAHFDPRSRQMGAEIFDRTHNQYLEILATTGFVGAIAFAGVWIAIGYSLYRAFAGRGISARELAVLAGANIAYATYLTFWFVDISAAIVWALIAALIASRCNPQPVLRRVERRLPRGVAPAAVLVAATALVFVLHRHAYVPIRASIALAILDSSRGNEPEAADAVRTISTSSAPQSGHFGPVLSNFIDASIAERHVEALSSEEISPLDAAFQTAIAAYDAELKRDPLNDRLYTSAAALLMDAAEVYGSEEYLQRAVSLLERAVELSPRRSQQRRLLAEASTDLLLFPMERRTPR